MDPLVVVSPHLDDAVLSCGQFLAGRPECTIVTVFAGKPDVAMSTEFDRNSGFASSDEAMAARRAEDANAARLLKAHVRHLTLLDDQYRSVDPSVELIAATLMSAVEATGSAQLVAPFGIAHPDHLLVSEAALQCVPQVDVVLYEELPSRVLWPEQVCARIVDLSLRGVTLEPVFIGDGPIAVKQRAVSVYVSQQWALNRRCLYVPERFHRVTA